MIGDIRKSFFEPEEEYTPIPFWFWNDKLTEEEIVRQIHDFHAKGVNGFVIHPRIGIPKEIEYLSDTFMHYVSCAVMEAEKLEMKVILYDEAMYPSGSAHGMVVKNHPEYASKALKVIEYKVNGYFQKVIQKSEKENIISVQAVQKNSKNEIILESIQKLALVEDEIYFQADHSGEWSVLVFIETFTNGHIRGIHFGEDDEETDAPASSDLLNKAAIEEFINLTHERYYEVLKNYFGKTLIGIFTDEPSIMGRGNMKGLRPWTGGFLEYYIELGNSELDLPLLWFDSEDKTSIIRQNYEAAVNKRMEECYYKPIYEWCENHNIALTGHPEKSDDIGFLKYFHIPAQDLIWRWVAPEKGLSIEGTHSTMAKCTSDSARHRGVRRNGNECFACCGIDNVEWAFTADDMKWYMDWLFVRGVNLLFPHAFFYSIDGPRRSGERPPDVGPNNIWWTYYNQISDYMKRMSFLMTESVNQAQVAVLCSSNDLPWQIVKPLYQNQIEFNYLENELFVSTDCKIEEGSIKIQNQTYRVLLIEDYKLINNENASKIQSFVNNGGVVHVYNPNEFELPIPLNPATSLFSFQQVVEKIDEAIIRDFTTDKTVDNLRVSHIKKDEADFYVLVNEGEEEINTTVTINTVGYMEWWDAFKGTTDKVDIIDQVGETAIEIQLQMKRREAKILFVDTKKAPIHQDCKEVNTKCILLDRNWHMGLELNKLHKINEFLPWNESMELEHYSGSMVYQTVFHIKESLKDYTVQLNLGEVYEIAEVTLNDKSAGVSMWSPHDYDVTDYIEEGENLLVIEVKNTLANRISNQNILSGLLGPVSLTYSSRK